MAVLQNDNRFKLADVLPAFFTLVAGAIFGGSMIFLTPPFDVPEEWQHFFRSFQCSEGIIYATRSGDTVGGEVPASFAEASVAIHADAKNEYEFRVSKEKFDKVARIPLDPARRTFSGFPVTARYSPVPYLPAAAAIRVWRRAGRTALEELYVARIGTLIGYLLLVVAAVWLMPIHKWTLAMVALMPMSIFLAASVSADALSIAFSLLAIAMIFRLAMRAESIGQGNLLWLGAILLFVALVKPAYVLIVFLFFLVPKDKFFDGRQCWRARAWMIGLPLAVSLAWALSVRGLCLPLRPCVNVKAQACWMLANPLSYLKIMAAKIADPYLYLGIIGILGWGTVLLMPIIYKIYWIALLGTAVLDGSPDDVPLPMRARGISVGVHLLVTAAIATLTYLTWQAVGEDLIHGVQSRYIVPLVPLLLLPLRGGAELASSRFSRWLVPAVAIVVVMIGMGATWQAVIARYYWH